MDDASMAPFLAADAVIDAGHPAVARLAATLAGDSDAASARRCFEWVRDHILHSMDFGRQEIACRASDVLATGSALCIGKSHLLVALLRALRIPAGLCYQRLTLDEAGPPYCTHCLVAVWLAQHGWYRCDARGNSKPGIACEFTPGCENLAYPVCDPGEVLYRQIWASPWPELVRQLTALPSMAAYCPSPLDIAPPRAGEGGAFVVA